MNFGDDNMECCMIETAFDNKDELDKVVEELLKNKLVVSCQVIESNNKWNWKGKLEQSKEFLLLMKTKKCLIKEVYQEIRKIHTYDCFEFAIFDLTSCNVEYLNWIEKETK